MVMVERQTLIGRVIDRRYRIVRLIGEGGMGCVYEGVHEVLGRRVAIKTLKPRLAYDPKSCERFLREAKAASRIVHPNVVQILDFGDPLDGSVYFVMEYLEGEDLGERLHRQGALPWARARPILLQMVSALGAAHDAGIVHRDIKPGNCFIEAKPGGIDEVKLLDFGIAKAAWDGEGDGEQLTGTGEVFGTASYMSPEQARCEPLDARSDVYSLGVVAYEMLTGRVPFSGPSAIVVLAQHLREQPTPPRAIDPSIPAAVEAMVLGAMAKDRNARISSMAALEQAIRRVPEALGEPGPGALAVVGRPEMRAQHVVPDVLSGPANQWPLAGKVEEPTMPGVYAGPEGVVTGRQAVVGSRLTLVESSVVGRDGAAALRRWATVLGLGALAAMVVVGSVAGTMALLSSGSRGAEGHPDAVAEAEVATPARPEEEVLEDVPSSGQASRPSSDDDDDDGELVIIDGDAGAVEPSSEGVGAAHRRPDSSTSACAEHRDAAKAAFDERRWVAVLEHTSRTSCWSRSEQGSRRGLRVYAYLNLRNYAKCVSAGRRVKDPEITRLVAACKEHVE